MKKQFLIYTAIVFFTCLFVSCDKDDDGNVTNVDTATLTNTLQDGMWAITTFQENGIDRTTNFSAYSFTFGANNVLSVTNGTDTFSGSWSVTADRDDDPGLDMDLNIFFSTSTASLLRALNDDWDIISYSENRIEVAEDYGELDADILIFEKQQ